jgi:hypothetical protein
VGRSSHRQFTGLNVGNQLRLADTDWTIVGAFQDGGAEGCSHTFSGRTVESDCGLHMITKSSPRAHSMTGVQLLQ